MGTAQDMLDLFDGDAARLSELESRVARSRVRRRAVQCRAGLPAVAGPRRAVGAGAVRAGPSSFAHTVRLMAGHELVTEGFCAGSGRILGHAAIR